ncbi:hypothetical protein [Haladaptatus sp. NG-SE-30]
MNRRSFLALSSAAAAGSLAGCSGSQLPIVGRNSAQSAAGAPAALPARQSTPYNTMYPDTRLDYTHDASTRALTISNTGGTAITPENTGWVALYTTTIPQTTDEEGRAPDFVTAWNVAGGDADFPTTAGQETVVEGIDIDQRVILEWCEPDGKLRNWERWDFWRDYYQIGYFSMELDTSTDEVVFGRPADELTLKGTGGYSVTVTVNRDYSSEYVLASPDGGAWGFPIENGSSVRVPVDELSGTGRVEPWWVGPNGYRAIQGTTTGAITLE